MFELWFTAFKETWIETSVANVISIQKPADKSLESQSISSMRTRTILPLNIIKQQKNKLLKIPISLTEYKILRTFFLETQISR